MASSPVKILVVGDRDFASYYYGHAHSQMIILEKQMLHQNISQSRRTVKINENVEIQCSINHNIKIAKIIVTGGKEELIELEKKLCHCFPCFTVGFIVGLTEGTDPDNVDKRYDVIVCEKEEKYVLVPECKTSDFADYNDGEKVLVSILWDSITPTLCCSEEDLNKKWGCGNPRSDNESPEYIITPLVCPYPKWKYVKNG